MARIVHNSDALEWLEKNAFPGCSFAASLPDFSEFPSLSLAEWKSWFENAARKVLSACPPEGVVIFYQRDIKREGEWVDKSYLLQKAAEQEGMAMLWHKIVARSPAGQATFGKPGYSHLLCFSRNLRLDLGQSTADLLPTAGKASWPRGMGHEVCEMICRFVLTYTTTRTLVVPFCGQGALLAVAEGAGLQAVGVEKSRKRAERALAISLEEIRDLARR
ncbi:MAG TPA: SAM-dependent methyltransferase [Bdellovibrionota bacterium]|jgi:hypothetical protein